MEFYPLLAAAWSKPVCSGLAMLHLQHCTGLARLRGSERSEGPVKGPCWRWGRGMAKACLVSTLLRFSWTSQVGKSGTNFLGRKKPFFPSIKGAGLPALFSSRSRTDFSLYKLQTFTPREAEMERSVTVTCVLLWMNGLYVHLRAASSHCELFSSVSCVAKQ